MVDADDWGDSLITFDTGATGTVIHVRDNIGTDEYALHSADPVSIEPASPNRFISPVDAAVSFTTTGLELPQDTSIAVRDERGKHRGQIGREPQEFERGTYYVEVSPSMKTYILIPDAAFTGRYPGYGEMGTRPEITFEEPTQIFVGVRSPHDRPQATITVPDDPDAIATAFSYLGSAIKEFSCERSWPTIRGHPPAIERGDELDVPDVLRKPDTGVTVAVPPTYAAVYRVAPLAYYLGADVVTEPDIEPELRLDLGHTEPLGHAGQSLEDAVDQLLARCFLLDTLVRIHGYYSFPRYEYDEVAPHLPFYPPELYDQPLDEQLMEYLEVSFDEIEPYVPQWPTTAVLRPEPVDVSVVPALLDSMSRIHVEAVETTETTTETTAGTTSGTTAETTETTAEAASTNDRDTTAFDPTVTAYAGRNPPAGETRLVPAAFTSACQRERIAPGDCQFRFLGADPAAVDEFERIRDTIVDSPVEGKEKPSLTHASLPTRAELRQVLAGDDYFVHFDGRVTDEGFVCADGVLAPADVEHVEVSVVSITGRTDVDALVPLVEHGAVAGVVFEAASPAEQVGAFAGYLAHTFSVAAAAALSAEAPSYRLVGDATEALVARQSPEVFDVTSVDVDEHRATYWTETIESAPLGSVFHSTSEFTPQTRSLIGAPIDLPMSFSSSEVVERYEEGTVVRVNGEVYPTAGDLTVENVRRSAQQTIEDAPEST